MPTGNDTRRIVIDRRFRGPPHSGNGGYSCGRLAAFVNGSAEVTLRRPPPLDTELRVHAEEDGTVALYDGDKLVATARPAEVTVAPNATPTFAEAQAASARTFPPETHKLPMCYVCGPDRAHGDGLRIHCGPLDAQAGWRGVVAAGWIPEAYMADTAGTVAPEFIWAALDCPTAYAMASGDGFPSILLGRQAVRIDRRPKPGDQCIVTAWQTGHEGRKFWSEGALLDAGGNTLAVCKATWIEVDRETLVGAGTQERASRAIGSGAVRTDGGSPAARGIARDARSCRSGWGHGVSFSRRPPSPSSSSQTAPPGPCSTSRMRSPMG